MKSIMERSIESSWCFGSIALLLLLPVLFAVPVELIHHKYEYSPTHVLSRRTMSGSYVSRILQQNISTNENGRSFLSRLPYYYLPRASAERDVSIKDSNETDPNTLPSTVSPRTTVQTNQSGVTGAEPSMSPTVATNQPTPNPNTATPVASATNTDPNSSNPDANPAEDGNEKNPAASISPNPMPSNPSDAGQNQPSESPQSLPSSSPKPGEQDETNKGPPETGSVPNEDSNENEQSDGVDGVNGDDQNSPLPRTKSTEPQKLTSFPFLGGIGASILVVGAAVYFLKKSDLCGGRRRSIAGQPYESVQHDDPGTSQPNNSAIESGEPVDADGWNDGWDDDWEPNSRPKAESMNV